MHWNGRPIPTGWGKYTDAPTTYNNPDNFRNRKIGEGKKKTMDSKKFNQILYDVGTSYSGYAYVRGLLERGDLGEYESLDALVMDYVERRKKMEELTMQLCNEFGMKE